VFDESKQTFVLWVAHGEIDCFEFLFKQIFFVHEENQIGMSEETRIANLRKDIECLVHAIRGCVLIQHLIILADAHNKQHSIHIVETVNPFTPLVALASDVKHSAWLYAFDGNMEKRIERSES
jgi:hypothetical protein